MNIWDLGYDSYDDYKDSPHWKRLVSIHITHNIHAKCWICGSGHYLLGFIRKLILHHDNYDHMGAEKLNRDVFVICEVCHQSIHFYLVIGRIKLFKVKLSGYLLRQRRLFLKSINCLRSGNIIASGWYILMSVLCRTPMSVRHNR
jgi:hypothetical protein